jgi:hypothetical protein
VSQQVDAVHAFAPIGAFVGKEPRCVNCHGAVNPHIDGIGSDPNDATQPPSIVEHGAGGISRLNPTTGENRTMESVSCMECHNNMVPKRDGSKSRWFTAPPFLSFVNKDATALCKQFKNNAGGADHFIGHLEDDNGGNSFAKTAFAGTRGLDPQQYGDLRAAPPAISHPELMRLGRRWVDAMGGKWVGDPACGCVMPKIEGTFTQIDSAPMGNTLGSGTDAQKILGTVVFAPVDDEPPVAPSFGEMKSSFFHASTGTITVDLHTEFQGLAGSRCTSSGNKSFALADLPLRLRRYLWLELADDGRYKLSLGLPDRIWQIWKMDVESVCRFPTGHVVRERLPVNQVALVLGVQEGKLSPEDGITGRLSAPIRQGPRSIDGNWSFAGKSLR